MRRKMLVVLICMLLTTISISTTTIADWSPGDGYKMHFPQLPDPFGWDVDATYVSEVFPQNGLADDWMCSETGPVSDIHFWGSWYNDLVGSILGFRIAIAEDIPANPPSIPYSRPGTVLWGETFTPSDWIIAGPWDSPQGWYDPGEGFFLADNHILYWQYNVEDIPDPFIQEEGTIYWLFISAIVLPDDPQPRWGWKSSLEHWNDDAVHGLWTSLDWYELKEPTEFTTSLDLSFVINGETGPTNDPPSTPNKPSGPTTVNEGTPYTYTTVSTDPNGDEIRYGFDFDDDGVIDPNHWTPYYLSSGHTCSVNITYYGTGTRYLRVKAEDEHGLQSGFSSALIITVTGPNDPPTTPSKPSGPDSGTLGSLLTFQTQSTDPDTDDIKYGWDWDGDGTVDEWSGLLSSGTTDTKSHMWITEGTFSVQVKAEDDQGAQSAFSPVKTVTISANTAPEKPSINGPPNGKSGNSYTYTATTSDDQGDTIYYWFDWDDGTDTGWVGPFSSGQTASESHIWGTKGTYSIKVKAKDEAGLISVWSDPFSISMPHIHNFNPLIWLIKNIIERFPLLEPYFEIVLN